MGQFYLPIYSQLEGVNKAQQEGKYKGRQPTALAKTDDVIRLTQAGFARKAVAKELNIGIASVYRILKEYRTMYPHIPLSGSRSSLTAHRTDAFALQRQHIDDV